MIQTRKLERELIFPFDRSSSLVRAPVEASQSFVIIIIIIIIIDEGQEKKRRRRRNKCLADYTRNVGGEKGIERRVWLGDFLRFTRSNLRNGTVTRLPQVKMKVITPCSLSAIRFFSSSFFFFFFVLILLYFLFFFISFLTFWLEMPRSRGKESILYQENKIKEGKRKKESIQARYRKPLSGLPLGVT